MSSQDKTSSKMNADGEDEVSENDEIVEEVVVTANDSVQQDDLEDSENEAMATLQKEKASRCMPVTNLPGIEGALFCVTETFPFALLPSTTLEDSTLPEQSGGSRSSHQSGSLVTGRSDGEKIPVQNCCELSVQSPCPGITVYRAILESHIDDTSQQGYKTRQIPFAVDNARSQEFHTLYVQEQIKVSFELQNQWQPNLVTQDAGREYIFRVPNIRCESENRVAPGAKSHFRVEYVGGPGRLCQEQGKITLTVDSIVQSTLFFSIAIWVPD